MDQNKDAESEDDKETEAKSRKIQGRKKKLPVVGVRPALSDSLVQRALMGQSLVIRDGDFQGEALRSLLMGECNSDDSDKVRQ